MRYRNASIMHIIEADCWTTIGPRTRFFNFATLNALRSFLNALPARRRNPGRV